PRKFISALKLNQNLAHRYNPTIPPEWRKFFEGKKLLDPFAGFGSIPLEALRLGLSATAVELLPTAYVFLKAVLEYPLKYGNQLVKDVEKWGNWITEQLRKDPLIQQLYDPDVAVYIGTWEIKCPHCGKWTPVIGNWWLARVKDSSGEYKRLAWMKPRKNEDDSITIEIVDLNRELKVSKLPKGIKVDTRSGRVILPSGRTFSVPKPNIKARVEQVVCLSCGNIIRYIDSTTGRHYSAKDNVPKQIREKLIWYVKYALTKYYEEEANLARLRLLVKIKVINRDLIFKPCTEADQTKLELAKKALSELFKQGDPDIPTEPVAPYGTKAIGGYLFIIKYGMTKWYRPFNPRQLLVLVKLVKLIREAGKRIKKEKLREGWSEEEAYKYAEAITTYLAIALVRYAGYSNITTPWKNYTGFGSTTALLRAVNIMVFRGIAMTWNWTDYNVNYDKIGFERDVNSMVSSLSYLVSAVSGDPNTLFEDDRGSNEQKADVLLDDATILAKLNPKESFDLIVTDPPYYDDVPYAELSDFYYVWLKRVLSDVGDQRLIPRFLPVAFFKKVGDRWIEVRTQWEEYAKREVGLNPPRLGLNATMEDGLRHFQNLLNLSFVVMSSKLRDDGLLVTYYAHTDPNAWKALLKAGWEAAGFRITNAFPVATESALRVIARGKLALDTSIIAVWRKGVKGLISVGELYSLMVEEASARGAKLFSRGLIGRDLIIGTLAATLAVATRYKEVRDVGKVDVDTLVDKYVYPATMKGIIRAVAKVGKVSEVVKSSPAILYVLVKVIMRGAKRKHLTSNDAVMLSIGTGADLNEMVNRFRVFTKGGGEESRGIALTLLEPQSLDKTRLEEFLARRGLNTIEPRLKCSVDALHVLEYYALTLPLEEFRKRLEDLRAKYPSYVEEALAMARIFARVLPEKDVEKTLCSRVIERLGPSVLEFLGR
ncbi:MAG: DUF1156 domain-containing protein, partial [Thermoprotei archaeon]